MNETEAVPLCCETLADAVDAENEEVGSVLLLDTRILTLNHVRGSVLAAAGTVFRSGWGLRLDLIFDEIRDLGGDRFAAVLCALDEIFELGVMLRRL